MTTTTESGGCQEELAAMIQELQANRLILSGLLDRFSTFRFMGGTVAAEPWNLRAMSSYVRNPVAADRFATSDVQRYRQLADTIMDLEQAIAAGTRPRTLRCRHDLADRFDRASCEIHTLADTLESATRAALGQPVMAPVTATEQPLSGRDAVA
jgi:hypothetical protein